jgi:ribosomal protein S18 acetylase RimI-like enzyme
MKKKRRRLLTPRKNREGANQSLAITRLRGAADIALRELSHLLASVGMGRRTFLQLRTALSRSTDLVAAHIDGRLVGFGRLVSDGVYYGTIWDVAVAPDQQGKHIGSALISELLACARARNLIMVGLFTCVENKGFYERSGFGWHADIHAMTRLETDRLAEDRSLSP